MRHLNKHRKLNRTSAHRSALFSNLATSLLTYGQVCTTIPKAKEIRGIVDKLISFGKDNTIHSRRLANKIIRNRTMVKKLFNKIAPAYKDNTGGTTRIIHNGFRKGDAAPLCIIELV